MQEVLLLLAGAGLAAVGLYLVAFGVLWYAASKIDIKF